MRHKVKSNYFLKKVAEKIVMAREGKMCALLASGESLVEIGRLQGYVQALDFALDCMVIVVEEEEDERQRNS